MPAAVYECLKAHHTARPIELIVIVLHLDFHVRFTAGVFADAALANCIVKSIHRAGAQSTTVSATSRT